MTKLTALVLAALTLVACSDAEPSSEPKEVTTASGVAPCPTAGAVNETEPSGSEELPNLVDRCAGAYKCAAGDVSANEPATNWFRKKGAACVFGDDGDIFYSDGRVESTSTGDAHWGEWSGDYTTFRWSRGTLWETCTRIANQ